MEQFDRREDTVDDHINHFLTDLTARLGLHRLKDLDLTNPESTLSLLREIQEAVECERRTAQALKRCVVTSSSPGHGGAVIPSITPPGLPASSRLQ